MLNTSCKSSVVHRVGFNCVTTHKLLRSALFILRNDLLRHTFNVLFNCILGQSSILRVLSQRPRFRVKVSGQ